VGAGAAAAVVDGGVDAQPATSAADAAAIDVTKEAAASVRAVKPWDPRRVPTWMTVMYEPRG